MENILEQIQQQYESCTKSERKIADYILAHKKTAQYISISELSSACKVAVSTVSLFCKKLGLGGFNDFKLELAKATIPLSTVDTVGPATGEICESDSIEHIFEKTCNASRDALLQTYHILRREAVEKAVTMLKAASCVYLLGQGNHTVAATAAWSKFATVSQKFRTVEDAHFQTLAVSTLQKDDVVMFFSYSGSTHEFLELASIIHSRGAKIILVTRFAKSPGASVSDCVLLSGSDEKPLLFGSIAAIVAQLYVIDVVFNCYCHTDFQKYEKIREFAAKALAYKCV